MKKLLAISAGRANGNTEILIKEALMAAEKKGVSVELIRLRDMEINKCNACPKCGVNVRNPEMYKAPFQGCIYKDDVPFIIEKFLSCDGFIMGGPVYSITPSSIFFTLRDRVFGPKMDVATAQLKKEFGELPWIKGRYHARPGGYISVGGALTKHWVSMGLAGIYTSGFSAQTQVVDAMNVTGVANPGAVTLRQDYLDRAAKLGENIAESMLSGDLSYKGDMEGVCPCCHLDLMMLDLKNKKATCPVCGISGDIVAKDGEITIDIDPDTEENIKENRFRVEGLITHQQEIRWVLENVYFPNEEAALEGIKKYAAYNACEVKSPAKEAKREALRKELAEQGKIKK